MDGSGDAYVTGYTWSSDFPTTSGAIYTTGGGTYTDAFATKIALDTTASSGTSTATWNTPETVDNTSKGDARLYTNIALDGSGEPHIVYYDYYTTSRDLKYATGNYGSFSKESLDTSGKVGEYTSIAVYGTGTVHISYSDRTNYRVKYIKRQ